MVTKVVNLRHLPAGWWHDPQYVYIGRRGKGFDGYFGNPLHTLDGYREWLIKKLNSDPVYRERVRQLSGKTLVCFCKPKPCHGDFLARVADLLALRYY